MKTLFSYVKFIHINSQIKDIKELFEDVAQESYDKGYVTDKSLFLKDLMEREDKMSTEIAEDIGMPHAKSEGVKESFVSVYVFSKGIKYSFGKKGKIFFVIGAPANDTEYLHIMASVARLLSRNGIKEKLLAANTQSQIESIIKSCEVPILKQPKQPKGIFVILILNGRIDKQKISELLISAGINMPTIIESIYGIKEFIGTFPFFAKMTMMGEENENSIVFTGISDDESVIYKIDSMLKEENINLSDPGIGVLLGIKADYIIGGKDEDQDF